MKRILTIFIACAAMSVHFSNSYAQNSYLDTSWVSQTPDVSEAIYHSSSLVHQGCLIVTGNVNVGGDIDVVTVKYKPNGDTLWMQTHSGSLSGGADYGVDVTVNSLGDVIVVAALENMGTSYDFTVYHYNGNTGTLNWTYNWNGVGGGDDIPTTVEIDNYNNIYIAGGSDAGSGFSDYGIIKLSPSGSLHWASYYDYANLHDAATKIVINNYVFVTGVSARGIGEWDLATLKVNPNTGVVSSSNRTNVIGATMVEATAMVTDSLNNMYITGYAKVAGIKNIQTIKLDSNLTEVWIKNYDGGFDDEGKDIVVDATGNVYITGYSGKASNVYSAITKKYDEIGNLVWSREFGNTENSVGAKAVKMALGEDDDVFITGTMANLTNVSSFFFTQYSTEGHILLSTEYNSLGIGDTAYNIHVVADSVYVTGLSSYIGTTNMTAMKFVLLQDVDYSYFYLNGKESVWCQQPGMYSFALTDGSKHSDVDSTIVSKMKYFPDGIHYVYFQPTANNAQMDSVISIIEGHVLFKKEYLVATQTRNNTKGYKTELYAGIDNLIEIVFNDPYLTNAQVDSFAAINQLDVAYYPPVGIHGGIFNLKVNQNNTNFSLASPTLTMDIAANLWEKDSLDFIKIVTPSLRMFRPHIPNDPLYTDMWWATDGVSACNGVGSNPTANINLPCAWNFEGEYDFDKPSYSGDGVVVAVIDFDGVQWNHPDMEGSFINGWSSGGSGEVPWLDIVSGNHIFGGTFSAHLQNVSGIIAANIDNNLGAAGIAYNSKIMPCLFSGSSAQLNRILQQLLIEAHSRQVDIINMSFGMGSLTLEEAEGLPFKIALNNCAVNGRDGKGISLIASAGNRNGEYLNIPAAYAEVFSVAATNPADQLKSIGDGFDPFGRSWGSSYFKYLDVAAPGICIISTDFSDSGVETGFPEYEGGGYALGDYNLFSGTSASAPIVSGIAALLLEKDSALTNEEVYEIIRLSADKVGGYTYSTLEPWGRCLKLGFGRVNACAAVNFNNELLNINEKVENQTNLNLFYNNPVTEQLSVTLNSTTDFLVKIYNPTGQLVYSEKFQNTDNFQIKTAWLPSGIYFLNVFDEKKLEYVTEKIIKN